MPLALITAKEWIFEELYLYISMGCVFVDELFKQSTYQPMNKYGTKVHRLNDMRKVKIEQGYLDHLIFITTII